MNIALTILVVFSPEGLKKTYTEFSNNTFPIDTGFMNLFYYIWKI